jgi:divalent metal cation (Fe/Co/Zn/Cd) transporter
MPGSTAILSDAAESVVHVVAITFAAYSLWLSFIPQYQSHPYGHDKIHYLSVGFEGALISLAAVFIIYQAIAKWIQGLQLGHLCAGTFLVAWAAVLNGALGGSLVWTRSPPSFADPGRQRKTLPDRLLYQR